MASAALAAAIAGVIACACAACAGTPLHERYDQTTPNPIASTSTTVADAAAAPVASFDPDAGYGTVKLCHPGAAGVDGGEAIEIAARHVLIQWMGCRHAPDTVVRTKDQAYAVAEEVLKRARAGDDLGRLANEYSDEPNAGSRAGSLPCFRRGTMDKRFERAAFALKVGQISDIVESDFGFHVIERTE